jgi:hypothetical protein
VQQHTKLKKLILCVGCLIRFNARSKIKVMSNTIKTDERIFQVENFEGDICLCNLRSFSVSSSGELLCKEQPVKRANHYWNNKFQTIRKFQIKLMLDSI